MGWEGKGAYVVWVVDEVDEAAADVVCELGEERLRFGLSQRSHRKVKVSFGLVGVSNSRALRDENLAAKLRGLPKRRDCDFKLVCDGNWPPARRKLARRQVVARPPPSPLCTQSNVSRLN